MFIFLNFIFFSYLSLGMNNPNEADSNLPRYLEALNQFKEESVEIKETAVANISKVDPMYYSPDNIKDETVEIKEDYENFASLKEEEPILDAFNAIENKSKDIKDEPFDDFADIKEEEHFTLPIADVFCPSTGDSRPLNIDVDEEINYSISQIAPPCSTTEPISCKRPRIVQSGGSALADHTVHEPIQRSGNGTLGQLLLMNPEWMLMKCNFCDSSYKMGAEMGTHVRMIHPEKSTIPKNQSTKFKKCILCDSSYKMGGEMNKHLQSMHPEQWDQSMQQKQLIKCDFCDGYYKVGNGMEMHVRSKHFNAMMMLCTFCDSSCMTGAEMKCHMRSMHPEEWDKSMQKMLFIKCDFCDGYYRMGNVMELHVRSRHFDDVKIDKALVKCDFCDRSYKKGGGIATHVRLAHPHAIQRSKEVNSSPNTPPISLLPCTATFKCTFCGSVYLDPAQMEYHVRSMHPEEWMRNILFA